MPDHELLAGSMRNPRFFQHGIAAAEVTQRRSHWGGRECSTNRKVKTKGRYFAHYFRVFHRPVIARRFDMARLLATRLVGDGQAGDRGVAAISACAEFASVTRNHEPSQLSARDIGKAAAC